MKFTGQVIMIFIRSPLRISLGGGGTDLPSYYSQFGGQLIAAAIDKYVYVSVIKPFSKGIFLKYSDLERVSSIADVRHPIIRESLSSLCANENQIEIVTLADIPSGTGLGSSGSFTTALCKALCVHNHGHISTEELAELSCDIEINKLNEPIGKQDQYIAAYGGICSFEFKKSGKVKVSSLNLKKQTVYELEDNLLLFFTGFTRQAGAILKDQKSKTQTENQAMLENLHHTKRIGIESKKAIENGDLLKFGHLLDVHWKHKRARSRGMSNSKIDSWYEIATSNGALGGKLVGAGGGGFLMFFAEDPMKLRSAMAEQGLEEVRFKFDFEGTKVLST